MFMTSKISLLNNQNFTIFVSSIRTMLTIPSNIKLLHHDTYKICSKIYEEADSMYISCFLLYRVQR